VHAPLSGFETARFKAGFTDYRHAELGEDLSPEVIFSNRSFESRLELTHKPLLGSLGFHGTFGAQTENTHFSALSAAGGPDTVPVTHSTSQAAFLVEETRVGPVAVNAGLRYENVRREPVGNKERSFGLGSGSLGALWPFMHGYSAGATVSYAQRAPSTDELYSGGPHDATQTFDVGNPDLHKEVSRNIELSLQKDHRPAALEGECVPQQRVRLHLRPHHRPDGRRGRQCRRASSASASACSSRPRPTSRARKPS
jgi:iron complex outermembrane receptor protein